MSRHTSPPGSGDGIVAGQINAPKVAGQPLPHVRFGSKADMGPHQLNVRFTPKSGHWNSATQCLLCANSGHHPFYRFGCQHDPIQVCCDRS